MGSVAQSQPAREPGIKVWVGQHYLVAAIFAPIALLMIGLLIGGALGGRETARLRAEVAGMQDAVARAQEDAEGDIALLNGEIDRLGGENSELASVNESLSLHLAKLNARRPMPNTVGRSGAFVERLAEKFGWDVEATKKFSTARSGSVLSQSPASGTMMRFQAPIILVLAKSPPRVPDLVGMSKGRALSELDHHNWQVSVVEQESTGKPGSVLAMSPSGGGTLLPGSTITITVAVKAPPPPPTSTASTSGSTCTAGYSPCLPPASDYDCAGGSGDGPKYTGYVTVTGSDPYGLDADNDGAGCET